MNMLQTLKMKDRILDAPMMDVEMIKEKLKKMGVRRFKEEKGKVYVTESDEVQVVIYQRGGQVFVQPKFPEVGNPTQMIISLTFVMLLQLLGLPFHWLVGLVIGQLGSLFLYLPRVNKLKAHIDTYF